MKDAMSKQGAALPDSGGESGDDSDDGGKSRRHRRIYVLLFMLWLFISIGLFFKMMESRHDPLKEEGELKPWHFVNTEE